MNTARFLIGAMLVASSGCETFKDRVAQEESSSGPCCSSLGIDVSPLLGHGGSDCGVIQEASGKSAAAGDNRLAKSCMKNALDGRRPFMVRYVSNVPPDASYLDIFVFAKTGEKVWIHYRFEGCCGEDSHVATCPDLKFGPHFERPQGDCVYDDPMLERILLKKETGPESTPPAGN